MKVDNIYKSFISILLIPIFFSSCSSKEIYEQEVNTQTDVLYNIQVTNPSLEKNGQGWKIALGNNWNASGLWSEEAHTGSSSARILTNSDNQFCVLYTNTPVKKLKPGMKILVSFYAKWLQGDNTVFIGFHVAQGRSLDAWQSLWKGSIPKVGKWNKIQAEVEVPAFLEEESSLYMRIGLPFDRQSMWKKPYISFTPSKYLIDDISIGVMDSSSPAQPSEVISHSYDSTDVRDNPSRFGVYWTPWKAYARTPIKSPTDYNRSNQEIEQELDLMQQAGVKWIRSIWRWDKIEWIKGKPEYDFLDYVVEEAWKRDIRFVPCLNTTPLWASTAPIGNSEYHSFPPKTDDWGDFVFQMVDHFKYRIKYWETWNEPNYLYWLGTLEDYFELQKTAYRAAKNADPTSKIMIGSYAIGGIGHLDELLHMGVKDYFDILSFHPYSLSKENVDNAVYKVKAMRLVLAQYGRDDVPIWFTEIGWTTGDAPLVDKKKRAELLNMLYKFQFHKAVEKIFWFPFDTWSSSLPPDFSGLVHVFNTQIYKSPSFEAYCEIAEKE